MFGVSPEKLFEVLGASLLMGIAAYFSLNFLDNIFDINTFAGIFSQRNPLSFNRRACVVWSSQIAEKQRA